MTFVPPSKKPQKIDLSKSKLFEGPSGPVLGKRKLKAIKKKERAATKGPQWFGMRAPELTDERKNDLEALKHRSALDTKTFYKRNAITTKPKYFQVGKIIETKADFYNSRIPKKQRKRTLAEEFMSELQT